MMNIVVILAVLIAGLMVFLIVRGRSRPELVREAMVERPFLALQGPAAIMRDGSIAGMRKVWALMRQAAMSVGIGGDHWVQRLVGSVILSAFALVTLYVDGLLALATLGGYFGSAGSDRIGPLPLEGAIAAVLVASLVVWGILFFDSMGITHVTLYASDKANPVIKRGLRYVSVIGFLAALVILVALGLMRDEMLSTAYAGPVASEVSAQSGRIVVANGAPATQEPSPASGTQPDMQPSSVLRTSARGVMIGLPIVSALTGLVTGTSLIAACGMLITFPLFLVCCLPLGLMWCLAQVGIRMIDLLYNWALAVMNLFLGTPRPDPAAVNAGAGQAAAVNPVQPPAEPPSDGNPPRTPDPQERPEPPPEHRPEPTATADPLYGTEDPNWNPLLAASK